MKEGQLHALVKDDEDQEAKELRRVLVIEVAEIASRLWASIEKDADGVLVHSSMRLVLGKNAAIAGISKLQECLTSRSEETPITFEMMTAEYKKILCNTEDVIGWVPLHWAASKGRVAAIKTLLEHGADANHKTTDGITAAHEAARTGRVDCLEMLHEFGANLDIESDNGNRPSHYAAKYGHEAVLRFLYNKVNFQASNNMGWTPYHFAARHGKASIIRLLDILDGFSTAPDKLGKTAMDLAVANNHQEVVDALAEEKQEEKEEED